MGEATGALAERMGPAAGSLLNASFGNAAELILAISALRHGHIALVKGSVTGSILANLLLGENVVPELLQHRCTADALAAALIPLLGDTEERRRQVEAFARLDAIMEIASAAPAARAADVVLDVVRRAQASR